MDEYDRDQFDKIIDGFEKHFVEAQEKDGLHDNPMVRAAFYSSCFSIVSRPNIFQSQQLQDALTDYYMDMYTAKYEELGPWLNKGKRRHEP